MIHAINSLLIFGLATCLVSTGIHLLVWLLAICRRLSFILHFDVALVLLFCSSIARAACVLIRLSLAVLALFLLFLLRLRRGCGQDCVELCLQRIDLIFNLWDGVLKILFFSLFG